MASLTTPSEDVRKIISFKNYPTDLIRAAEQMLNNGQYEASVVTCQMACEISVERALSTHFRSVDIKGLEDAVIELLPSFNLANEKVRKLYTAISGDEIHKEFFWREYKTMVQIRNKAVHAGVRVEKSQAQMILRVSKLVLKHLEGTYLT